MSRKTRVLVDGTSNLDTSGARGIGRLLRDLLHALADTADEHEDLEIEALVDLSPLGRARTTHDLRAAAAELHERRGTLEERVGPRRQRFLPWAARGHDVVHLLEPRGVPWWSPAKMVLTLHDLVPLRYPRQYIGGSPLAAASRRVREGLRARRVEQVVAISARTRTDLEALLRLDPRRITVVPNGIDLGRWSSAPREDDAARASRLGLERPFALYVGYCDHRKNIAVLLDALARARAEVDLELAWVGKLLPEDVARVQQEIARRGLGGRVHLLGYVDDDDLAALYRRAVAHPFLSRLEGFGLSVVEALASGCPVLVARDSGSDEVAGDAAAACLDPDDVAGAADCLVTLAGESPAQRAVRATTGLARAREFDRVRMARGYVDVYRAAAR